MNEFLYKKTAIEKLKLFSERVDSLIFYYKEQIQKSKPKKERTKEELARAKHYAWCLTGETHKELKTLDEKYSIRYKNTRFSRRIEQIFHKKYCVTRNKIENILLTNYDTWTLTG